MGRPSESHSVSARLEVATGRLLALLAPSPTTAHRSTAHTVTPTATAVAIVASQTCAGGVAGSRWRFAAAWAPLAGPDLPDQQRDERCV